MSRTMVSIQPKDIDASQHFWDAFDHNETEISAGWIVRFAQQRGKSWEPFTESEIEDFYRRESGGKFEGFRFNRLIHPGTTFSAREGSHQKGGGWLRMYNKHIHFTDQFVEACHSASPQKHAQDEAAGLQHYEGLRG